MKLSSHFTLDELTHSQAAVRRGLDNDPPPLAVENLRALAGVLEQVRALAGRPIVVSSGYRSPVVNKAVGGSATSAHMLGLAADITCPGMTPRALAILIRDSGIEFDQCINEGNAWCHIGLSQDKPRRQVLTATFKGGRAHYSEGLA